ncbi:MAG: response regulator [Bacteroidia bacterium]|nr:response regulator [Bacteroidia bacterium]
MKIKILLIDDDIICNMANERLMRSMEMAIETKSFIDPTKALLHLEEKKENYDLVLLDINMPKLNGWEFLDQYQTLEKRFPIVMLTSSIDANDQKRAKSYKILSGYYVKPLRKSDLLEIFNTLRIKFSS